MTAPAMIDPRYYDGVIFDLDHVVTDMSGVEAAAWRQLLNDYSASGKPPKGEDHKTTRGLPSRRRSWLLPVSLSSSTLRSTPVQLIYPDRPAGRVRPFCWRRPGS